MRLVWALALWLAAAAPAWAGYEEPVACSQLPALAGNVTSSAGACSTTIATVPSGATIQDAIHQQFVASTAELDQTNTATLATVTGLSINLTAGKTYNCRGHLTTSSSATAGLKVALVATSSLSATSASFTGHGLNGATVNATTTVTALGSSIIASNAVYSDVYIDGAIVVNAGGTINVQAAQNTATTGATNTAKVLINSTFSCVRVN